MLCIIFILHLRQFYVCILSSVYPRRAFSVFHCAMRGPNVKSVFVTVWVLNRVEIKSIYLLPSLTASKTNECPRLLMNILCPDTLSANSNQVLLCIIGAENGHNSETDF